MAIDFELSGQGPSAAEDISLADIQEAAVECGFTKPGVSASKPNAKRANLTAFFKALGVTCVSGFKKRFHAEKLPCPYPDMTPLIMEKVRFSRSRGAPILAASPRAPRTPRPFSRGSGHTRRSGHTQETLTTFPKHFFFFSKNITVTKRETKQNELFKTGQTERREDHVVRSRRLRVRRARRGVGGKEVAHAPQARRRGGEAR